MCSGGLAVCEYAALHVPLRVGGFARLPPASTTIRNSVSSTCVCLSLVLVSCIRSTPSLCLDQRRCEPLTREHATCKQRWCS